MKNITQTEQTMQNTTTKTTLVQSPLTTLGQEMRWAYSTLLTIPYGAKTKVTNYIRKVWNHYSKINTNTSSSNHISQKKQTGIKN